MCRETWRNEATPSGEAENTGANGGVLSKQLFTWSLDYCKMAAHVHTPCQAISRTSFW